MPSVIAPDGVESCGGALQRVGRNSRRCSQCGGDSSRAYNRSDVGEFQFTAEADFDVLRFDGDWARAFGAVAAALRASGRKPAARAYDALIAASAIAHAMPLYTCKPADFVDIPRLDLRSVTHPHHQWDGCHSALDAKSIGRQKVARGQHIRCRLPPGTSFRRIPSDDGAAQLLDAFDRNITRVTSWPV